MKNNNHQKPHLSDADVERALAETLRLAGMALPENADDVEAFEEGVDIQSVPTPDVEKLRRQLAGEPQIKLVKVTSAIPFPCAEHAENWAMAARNGAPISPEVQKLMNADRAEHEKLKRKS